MSNWFLQTWAIRAVVVSRLSSARLAVRFLYGNTPFISFLQCVGTGIKQVLLWLIEKTMKIFKTPTVGDTKPARLCSSPVMQDDSILCTLLHPSLEVSCREKSLGRTCCTSGASPPGLWRVRRMQNCEFWTRCAHCSPVTVMRHRPFRRSVLKCSVFTSVQALPEFSVELPALTHCMQV